MRRDATKTLKNVQDVDIVENGGTQKTFLDKNTKEDQDGLHMSSHNEHS